MAMLPLARLFMAGSLALAVSACGTVARDLAGQADPDDFSWEQYQVAPAKTRAIGTENEHEGRRETLFDAAGETPPPVETPKLAPAATPQRPLSENLKDCMAPDLTAEAGGSGDAPTIRRSEDSPMVATCMSAKGYRKVHRQWHF